MTLVDRITTNHTYFMREGEHFAYLFEVVLPYFENALKDGDFRLWSAGCATGEEPYNIAFILEDFFRQKFGWDKKILATDISEGALSIAKRGVYSEKQIEPLPAKWNERFLESAGAGQFSVRAGIKNEVLFAPFKPCPGRFFVRKEFHVIFLPQWS
jgi:chemotaxis protein methyltransferase CheR